MILQGKSDEAIRLEDSAEPLFALFPEPSSSCYTTAAHAAPELFVKELNAWLDRDAGGGQAIGAGSLRLSLPTTIS